MSADPVSRTHRIVGVIAGVFFGSQVAVLGVFGEMVATTAVAGLCVAAGLSLLVPALIYASETGGFPPTTDESVFGTGLNPGALGMSLDVGGLAMVFAGFVFATPLLAIATGLSVLAASYLLLEWAVPQESAETEGDTGDGLNVSGLLGVAAGIAVYNGASAWSQSRVLAVALVGVAVALAAVAARKEGYL